MMPIRLDMRYLKRKEFESAVYYLDQVVRVDDSLGQISMYKIAESYQILKELLPARSAFEAASQMTAIPKISEGRIV